MTQPVAPELTSKPIGGATAKVEVAGAPERDLFYLRSPVTNDVRGVTQEQAAELISRYGWEPVVEPAAERLLQRQLLREGTSPWTTGVYGAARGLTGGLVEYMAPQGEEPGAEAMRAVREAHPGVALGSEIAGGVLPFLIPGVGPARMATLPGLAEGAGAALTRGLAGSSPGVARAIAARVAGMAFEGGAVGSVYNAGESAIEDTPLTAQKLMSGFLAGATPGAILGAPIGAVEGLAARYGLKGGLLRENLVRPGVDDLDLMQIAQREHGVEVPGLSDELAANMSGVSPELVKMAKDNGKFGQGIRAELLEAPQRRVAAEARAAEALNNIRDLDELAVSGVAGRMKAEQVRKWIPESQEIGLPDAQQAVMDALRADTPEQVARQGAATVPPGGLGHVATVSPPPSLNTMRDIAKEMPRPSKDAVAAHVAAVDAHPMTPEQAEAVRAFSFGYDRAIREIQAGIPDEEIIRAYQAEYGTTKTSPPTKETAEEHIRRARELIPALEDYVRSAPKATDQPVVYRGMVVDKKVFDQFLNSDVIELGGKTTSSSYDPQVARSFISRAQDDTPATEHGVLLKLHHQNGVGVGSAAKTRVRIEREILLPGDSKFKVIGRYKDPANPKNIIIEAEEIGRAATPAQPVMAPELNAMRANYARATGRMERQELEAAAREQFGEDAARYVRGEKPAPLDLPKRPPIQQRGAVSTVEFAPGREGELARAARAGKMADILQRWAAESPEAAASLRNGLAAGPSSSSLRSAIRRALANGDENFLQVFRDAYGSASEESRAALGKRLLNAGHAPGAPMPQRWKAHALDLVDELGQEADALATARKGVVGKKAGSAKEIVDLLAEARLKIQAGDKAQAFIELDYLKKRLGKYAAPGEYLSVDQNVAAMARRQYEDLRSTLEDPILWGDKAALAQKDINRIFTQRINRADVFWDKFFVDSGKAHPQNPWIRQREATPESVQKALAGIIDPKNSREFQAFRQHIAESRDVLANLKNHYALTDGEASKLALWSKAVGDAEKAFTEATHYAQREAQAAKLFSNQAKLVPGWGKWVAMHFLGPAGFLAVAAAERATNPGARVYARAVLERTLRSSESRIARAVTRILTGKTLKLTGVGATQTAGKGVVSLFHDKGETRREAYASTLKELAQLSTPEVAAEHVSKAMPFAVTTLPAFPQIAGMQLARVSQYLLEKAPQRPRWTPQGTTVAQPSDTELHEFEARMRGGLDPITTIEDAAAGESVPMAQVEAAEFAAPELMDHVRLLVLDELANGGHEMGYRKTITLSRVLGVALDRTLEPEYINAQQLVYAGRAKSMPNPSDLRSTGQEDGVNKEYRMTKDQKIELGAPVP